ncbi:MAG: hypothetical protein AAB438_02360 [Patescibacteria group bacterium]
MKNLIFSILTFCIGLQAHAQKDSVFNQQTYQWEPAVEEFTEKSPGKQLGIFYELDSMVPRKMFRATDANGPWSYQGAWDTDSVAQAQIVERIDAAYPRTRHWVEDTIVYVQFLNTPANLDSVRLYMDRVLIASFAKMRKLLATNSGYETVFFDGGSFQVTINDEDIVEQYILYFDNGVKVVHRLDMSTAFISTRWPNPLPYWGFRMYLTPYELNPSPSGEFLNSDLQNLQEALEVLNL